MGGGGGALRVINRGGVCRGGAMVPALGLCAEGRCPGREGGLEAARAWLRTGGDDTGFPATAARGVGLAAGWGTICAWASLSAGTRTACFATDSPLLKTFFGTAVVAMVLYA